MDVLKAWNFRYQASLVWPKIPNGYGEYWRPAHETVLLGVRSKLPFRDGNLPSCVDGQQASPSRDPSHIRHLLECASPGPYLDLCGSVPAAGWTLATDEDAVDEREFN